MGENMRNLADRVSAENWERFLPPPSTVRGKARRAPYNRPIAILGAAAVVAVAVVVPTTLANRMDDSSGRAASGPAQPAAAPCVTPTSSLGVAAKLPDLPPALLTVADAVPGHRPIQGPGVKIEPDTHLVIGGQQVPGLEVGQLEAGRSSITTSLGTPSWQLLHQVLRYSQYTVMAAYAAAAAGIRRAGGTVVSERGGAQPELIAKLPQAEKGRSPKAADWVVVTRSGDCVSAVMAWSMATASEVPADGPGLAYLRILASVVRAKSVGAHSPKLPLPGKADPARVPKGYLHASDLGTGTWLAESANDPVVIRSDVLPTRQCTSGPTVALTSPARQQIYRGALPDQDWILAETVLRMSTADAVKYMAAIRAFADSTCSVITQVTAASDVGDDMVITHATRGSAPSSPTPGWSNGVASESDEAWVRVGGTIIHLDVRVQAATPAAESIAVPGANSYLTNLARKAVTRARGN